MENGYQDVPGAAKTLLDPGKTMKTKLKTKFRIYFVFVEGRVFDKWLDNALLNIFWML